VYKKEGKKEGKGLLASARFFWMDLKTRPFSSEARKTMIQPLELLILKQRKLIEK
jgi:hypothetical protein